MTDIYISDNPDRSHQVGDNIYHYKWSELTMPFGPVGGFTAYYETPFNFRSRLCYNVFAPIEKRHQYESDRFEGGSLQYRVCLYCGRYPAHFLRKCALCGIVFIKDFLNPKYCMDFPCCWDCMPKLPWTHCPDYSNKLANANSDLVAPLGINPKIFSKAELDDFDIFAEL